MRERPSALRDREIPERILMATAASVFLILSLLLGIALFLPEPAEVRGFRPTAEGVLEPVLANEATPWVWAHLGLMLVALAVAWRCWGLSHGFFAARAEAGSERGPFAPRVLRGPDRRPVRFPTLLVILAACLVAAVGLVYPTAQTLLGAEPSSSGHILRIGSGPRELDGRPISDLSEVLEELGRGDELYVICRAGTTFEEVAEVVDTLQDAGISRTMVVPELPTSDGRPDGPP